MEANIKYRGRGCNQTKVVFVEEVYVLDITEEQRAWVAGLIDAEGTITMRVAEQSAVVSIYNNNTAILEEVFKLLGFGKLSKVSRKQRSEAFADSYMLTWQSQQDVCKILAVVRPYLKLKSAQADLLMHSCLLARCDRFAVINQVHELNAKGQVVQHAESQPTVKVQLNQVSSIDWAYLAGYIEGDGTFCINVLRKHSATPYYVPCVQVIGTKFDVLVETQKRFGGYLNVRQQTKENWAKKCNLTWQDQATVYEMLKHLRPYIKARRAEVDILLDSFTVEAKDREPFRQRLFELRGQTIQELDEAEVLPQDFTVSEEGELQELENI